MKRGYNPALSPGTFPYSIGAWRSPVAHLHGVQGVVGSNPIAPTELDLTGPLRETCEVFLNMTPEFVPISSFNRKALLGFVLSILALLALCAGLLPLPLTVLICYPPGFILAIAALILGFIALRETKTDGTNGRSLAMFAVWGGGITLLAMICLISIGALLFPYISDFLQQGINQVRP